MMQSIKLDRDAFAKCLRHFRSVRNLSQIELAARSGVAINTIWRIENKTTLANVNTLIRLSYALNVSTDMLLGINRREAVSSDDPTGYSLPRELDSKLKLRALHRHTAHYTGLYDNAEGLMWAMDLDGILVEFNSSFNKLLGYDRPSLIGTPGTELLSTVSLQLSHTMREKKMQGTVETVYPITFVTKGNDQASVNVRTQLIFELGVPIGIQGVGHLVA